MKGLVKKPKIRDVSSWPREQDEQGPEEEKMKSLKDDGGRRVRRDCIPEGFGSQV